MEMDLSSVILSPDYTTKYFAMAMQPPPPSQEEEKNE